MSPLTAEATASSSHHSLREVIDHEKSARRRRIIIRIGLTAVFTREKEQQRPRAGARGGAASRAWARHVPTE